MAHSPCINIALAFNHQLFRNSLQSLIETDQSFAITASVSSGIELVQALNQREIDIVLLDYSLPIKYGESVYQLIQFKNRNTKIIVINFDNEYNTENYCLTFTANTYLSNKCNFPELITAIKSVYANNISNTRNQLPLKPNYSINRIDNKVKLSKRELDIVKLICLEKCNSEIAFELNISLRTVENHRYTISKKIGAKNGIGFFIYALINGHVILQE